MEPTQAAPTPPPGHWTKQPPERDGIYWFSLTGDARAARPESFNRTNDGVMRFTHRAGRREDGGLFHPATYFANALWWSEPLVLPPPPIE